MKYLFRVILFIFLTVITQVGGIVYCLSLLLANKFGLDNKYKMGLFFMLFYIAVTCLVIPFLAPVFGREKIKHSKAISPTNYMTVLLNRNYVKPELNQLLQEVELKLEGTNIKVNYLDANFPFINKFPLLPHLSHNDGKKIDISLIYETKEGTVTNKQKSISGYGYFESPRLRELNQINICKNKGYTQYDFSKYITFGKINKSLVFSEKGTQKLIQSFLKNKKLRKIFIEPHLKTRLNLSDSRVRFHGCKAVRHDDHIHVQI